MKYLIILDIKNKSEMDVLEIGILPSNNLYAPPTTMISIATSFAAVNTFCTLVARLTL